MHHGQIWRQAGCEHALSRLELKGNDDLYKDKGLSVAFNQFEFRCLIARCLKTVCSG